MNYAKLLTFEVKGMEKTACHENLQNVILFIYSKNYFFKWKYTFLF